MTSRFTIPTATLNALNDLNRKAHAMTSTIDQTTTTTEPPVPGQEVDDLTGFKRRLRRQAMIAARDMGWCDSGLNEVLSDLGLPPKRNYTVRVNVKVSQQRSLPVAAVDAESRTEARTMLTEEDVKSAIQANYGTGYTLESYEIVEPMNTGERDYEIDETDDTLSSQPGFSRMDACESTRSGYYCTREPGHRGNHAGGDGRRIAYTWANTH